MKAQEFAARIFSHIIPRKRTPRGEIIPRSTCYTRPLITLDGEALLEWSEEFALDPRVALAKLPWLRARNALTGSQNVEVYRQKLEEEYSIQNQLLEEKMNALKLSLEPLELELSLLEPLLAEKAVPFGFTQGAASLNNDNSGLLSLEELSGLHNLPPPHEKISWCQRSGYKLLAGLGGGAVFGISLGLLTGKLELVSLRLEWQMLILWCVVGATVMTLVGAALYPLSLEIGEGFYRAGRRLAWLSTLRLVLAGVFLLSLIGIFVKVESRIEALGLFKAIGEQTSLTGYTVAPGDLLWVSLMLVVPTISTYVVLGLTEGQRQANLARLRSLRAEAKTALLSDPNFALAAGLFQKVQGIREKREAVKKQKDELRSQLQTDLTTEEKYRLEDMEMDAAGASWELEDALANCRIHPVSSAPGRNIGDLIKWMGTQIRKWSKRSAHNSKEQ